MYEVERKEKIGKELAAHAAVGQGGKRKKLGDASVRDRSAMLGGTQPRAKGNQAITPWEGAEGLAGCSCSGRKGVAPGCSMGGIFGVAWVRQEWGRCERERGRAKGAVRNEWVEGVHLGKACGGQATTAVGGGSSVWCKKPF